MNIDYLTNTVATTHILMNGVMDETKEPKVLRKGALELASRTGLILGGLLKEIDGELKTEPEPEFNGIPNAELAEVYDRLQAARKLILNAVFRSASDAERCELFAETKAHLTAAGIEMTRNADERNLRPPDIFAAWREWKTAQAIVDHDECVERCKDRWVVEVAFWRLDVALQQVAEIRATRRHFTELETSMLKQMRDYGKQTQSYIRSIAARWKPI